MKMYDFSIIVPVLNGEKYISTCIESLISQKSEQLKLQIIVVDGGSIDNTLKILIGFSHEIDTLITINGLDQCSSIKKGIEISSGKIITWLNADDKYNSSALLNVKEVFEKEKEVSFVYGNCVYVNENNEVININISHSRFLSQLLRYTDFMLSQESCFFTKECYMETGGIDTSIRYAMDYDLFCKMIRNHKSRYINKNLTTCLVHKNQRHRDKILDFTIWNIERASIQRRNNLRKNLFLRFLIVIVLMIYKNIMVERKMTINFDKIISITFFKPFLTHSILKQKLCL